MLKRLLSALMCITMATSFVACGEEDKKDKDKDSSSEIVAEEETEDPEKAAQEIEEAEKAAAELEQEALEEAKEAGKDTVDSILEENGLELNEDGEEYVDDALDNFAENALEVGENAPEENNDTIGLVDILTSGDWSSYTIAATGLGLEEMTIEDYAAMGGVDPSTMEMIFSFEADGNATMTTSIVEGPVTYVVDGENVYITDATGAGTILTYDEATGLLSYDMLGDGSMIMTFAVGQ